MKKHALWTIFACILCTGCNYFDFDFEFTRDCTVEEMSSLNELYDRAESYHQVAQPIFDSNWSDDLDFNWIFSELRDADHICASWVEKDSGEPNTGLANLMGNELYINVETDRWMNFIADYYVEPIYDYDQLSEDDKIERISQGGQEEFEYLNTWADDFYQIPNPMIGTVVHEGVHLYLGMESKHTYGDVVTAEERAADVCCVAKAAFTQAGKEIKADEISWLEQTYLDSIE